MNIELGAMSIEPGAMCIEPAWMLKRFCPFWASPWVLEEGEQEGELAG